MTAIDIAKEYPLLCERDSGRLVGREGMTMKLGAVVGMRDDPEAFAKHLKKLEDAGV